MAKRAKPEEIIAKLREAEVRLSQGKSVGVAAKSIENFNQQGRVNIGVGHNRCDKFER